MKKISNWQGFGVKLAIFTVAIALTGTLVWQAYAADWNHSSDESKGAFIGVYPEDIDGETREALDYKGDGILVEDVVDDGPAEKAGLKPGDIITKIDSDKIKGTSHFREILGKHSKGDKIVVTALRDGATKEYPLELAGRKNVEYSFNFKHGDNEKHGFLGVVTESIEGDFAKYFGVEDGALIKKVVEDSPAEMAGLKAGDVLVEIGGEEIEGTDDVSEAIQEHKPEEQVKVKYVRSGKEVSVDVKLAASPNSSWKMSNSDGHRIIISNEDEIVVDSDELHRAIREVMEEVRDGLHDGRDEMREEMRELKIELEKLKKEIEAKK